MDYFAFTKLYLLTDVGILYSKGNHKIYSSSFHQFESYSNEVPPVLLFAYFGIPPSLQ